MSLLLAIPAALAATTVLCAVGAPRLWLCGIAALVLPPVAAFAVSLLGALAGNHALFAACDKYFRRTGRRISFEYAMIDGVNDTGAQAELLASRVKPLGAHVNLIPLNKVEERRFEPSSSAAIRRFTDILKSNGVNVTVRRRLGSDVNASCGQLRRNSVGSENDVFRNN